MKIGIEIAEQFAFLFRLPVTFTLSDAPENVCIYTTKRQVTIYILAMFEKDSIRNDGKKIQNAVEGKTIK